MKKTRLLESLGFDEKTEKVYRALLSLADAPASRIAKEIGMKRTSVYYVLEELVSIGLVSSYTSHGARRYFAESPIRLKSFFEQKMILAQRLIPLLQKDIDQSCGKAVLRIFEGVRGITSISEESLEAKEKTILSIGSSTKFLEFVGGKQGYGERRRRRGMFVRALRFEEDGTEGGSGHLHEVRILPEGLKFPGLILVFDKKVGIILFEGNGLGFVVESEAFSRMIKSVFEWLWDEALPHRRN